MAKAASKTTEKAAPKATKKPAAKKATTKRAAPKAAATKAAATKTKAATKTATKTATKKTATKAKTATKKATKKATATKTATKNSVPKSNLKNALKAAAAKQATKAAPPEIDQNDPKAKIAPAPMRPALRVAKRAEARRDKNQTFKVNTQIIYPAHGVGHIVEIEKQTIGDFEVELFVINFEHEKMKLRVPIKKAAGSGMRNLSTDDAMTEALELIEGKARVKRTMWSRRAQEYEAKINSGDLTSVAEVVRDLFRADDQPEQSYSERQLFEQARERLGRELGALRKRTLEEAIAEIHKHLDRKERNKPAVEAAAS